MTKRTDPPDLTAASAPAKPAPLYDAETDLPRTEDGVPHLQFEQIRRVGLADLTVVAEYHVEPCVGAVSHHIRLVNGGVIRFASPAQHTLLDELARLVDAGAIRSTAREHYDRITAAIGKTALEGF